MDKTNVMSQYPPVGWAVGTVAAPVLYTWLFNNTGGSVLMVTIFHAMSNTAGRPAPDPAADVVPDTPVTTVLAALIVVVFGATHLSRRRERRVRRRSRGAREQDPGTGRLGTA